MTTCKDCFHWCLCKDDGVFYSQGAEGCASWADKENTVEVVRCKDCDWYREDGSICVNPHCGKSFYGCRVRQDHFCSYGERKGNDG